MKRSRITIIDKNGKDIGFIAPNCIRGWGNGLAEASKQAKAIGGTVSLRECDKVTFKAE